MKISNNAPQHLSNYEVLQHFLELKTDNDRLQSLVGNHTKRAILNARAQYPLGKFDRDQEVVEVEDAEIDVLEAEDVASRRGVSDELVWVQEEVLKYLCADYNVTARQTEDGIQKLADDLQDYKLTKAELLQVCNLAPGSDVALHMVIEEPETRLAHPYEETISDMVANVIAPTLLPSVPTHLLPFVNTVRPTDIAQTILDDTAEYGQDEEGYEEEEYVYEAEWGAGREGAIDDEEDNTMD
ncbi:uncharacterized protein EHS24_006872 [Apiotrichum porosum]|uniref:DNA-directed RNA polymerase III subunit RPC9 n=1 Tax=Apiotrichum porosum TaxID=105984 RepID=A0A427XWE4_9TREE|nr:uncharacterized protein EHS24_006872 [Apiotrichum porosum]RSH83208.1 hypothetical protein EHS24_006872 [Apiotrichum porosum]